MGVCDAKGNFAADHFVNQPPDDFFPPALQSWLVRTTAEQPELSRGDVPHIVGRGDERRGNLLVDANQIQARGQKLPEQP